MSKIKIVLIIAALVILTLFVACDHSSVNNIVQADESSHDIGDTAAANQNTALSLEEVAQGIDLYANEVGVLEAIERRTGARSFADKAIPNDVIARLLWSAHGVIASERDVTEHGIDVVSSASSTFRYSIPNVSNTRFIHVYLITPDGSYEYIPESSELELITTKNLMDVPSSSRGNIQCHIVLSIDFNNFNNAREWAALSVGTSAQNIYLYAASEGIGAFAKGMFNDNDISKELGPAENNEPYLLMSLGYLE